MAGLSYRDIAYVCRVVDVSHVSVWHWVHRIESVKIDMNPIERWFRTLKNRTKDSTQLQTRKGIIKINLFLNFFILWYNWIRPHQTLGKPPAIT
ncbi:MAG: hypothetical protein QW511_00160 [Candidatus Methanomethylicia archaeon]